jgi:Ca2+-binding RTX toxin-like protein
MFGGGGNDAYIFDDIGDRADETNGGGLDTIYTAVSVDLTASGMVGDLDNVVLQGTSDLSATGNGIANAITGNVGRNLLRGGSGNDMLEGGGGKDGLKGGGGFDTASYANSLTKVKVDLTKLSNNTNDAKGDTFASIEQWLGSTKSDSFKGKSGAQYFSGGSGSDTLSGGNGLDRLAGGVGKDQLTGGSGKDRFVFDVAPVNGKADTIKDFRPHTDTIALDDAIFAAIGVKLEKGEFYARAGATRAHDGNDLIIYNKSNGRLYYDADSKGGAAAIQFATLEGKPGIDAHSFEIV